jgi:hypothetical protein
MVPTIRTDDLRPETRFAGEVEPPDLGVVREHLPNRDER